MSESLANQKIAAFSLARAFAEMEILQGNCETALKILAGLGTEQYGIFKTLDAQEAVMQTTVMKASKNLERLAEKVFQAKSSESA